VSFSHIPYAEALKNGDRQQAIMNEVMAMENIESRWDSTAVEERILSLL
jgi:kynurenine 3-monooxygenase